MLGGGGGDPPCPSLRAPMLSIEYPLIDEQVSCLLFGWEVSGINFMNAQAVTCDQLPSLQ